MRYFFLIVAGLLFVGCASYKQNIMLRETDTLKPEVFQKQAGSIEKDYVIQKNDILKVEVFSNKGERIIDPNPELTQQNGNNSNDQSRQRFEYLVDENGMAKLPVIGEIRLEGFTLREAEKITQKEYELYFKEAFVIMEFRNKRIVFLGATGGQVIPLTNQNVSLAEAIALAKGLPNDSKAHTIKVIRDNHVYQIDLSTLEGFKAGNMIMEPGDIVYIDPIRRPFSEGLRDNAAILSLLVSITSLIVIVSTTNN
jgi:polysaccharide export outer membrane protein